MKTEVTVSVQLLQCDTSITRIKWTLGSGRDSATDNSSAGETPTGPIFLDENSRRYSLSNVGTFSFACKKQEGRLYTPRQCKQIIGGGTNNRTNLITWSFVFVKCVLSSELGLKSVRAKGVGVKGRSKQTHERNFLPNLNVSFATQWLTKEFE